ncbi:cold shock domain-containing protein [Streptomyces sp. 21So2-11]|uniref:cold shock domain-containing protein n=1 Tax=Streptomyces sp. 21So2-11 TaxID=3144408 RepID=UPI00321BDD7F
MSTRSEGLVQYFNREQGYGFIVPFGRNDPVYVRREDIEGECRSLSEEQHVSFTLQLADGRFEARQVRP